MAGGLCSPRGVACVVGVCTCDSGPVPSLCASVPSSGKWADHSVTQVLGRTQHRPLWVMCALAVYVLLSAMFYLRLEFRRQGTLLLGQSTVGRRVTGRGHGGLRENVLVCEAVFFSPWPSGLKEKSCSTLRPHARISVGPLSFTYTCDVGLFAALGQFLAKTFYKQTKKGLSGLDLQSVK